MKHIELIERIQAVLEGDATPDEVHELDRQLAAVQAVLDDRPDDPGGALRTQGHRPATPVGEGVHLLGHHVG